MNMRKSLYLFIVHAFSGRRLCGFWRKTLR